MEVPGHVLQHFWDLANVQADVRQKSAVSLVTELKSAQDAHGPDGADVEMGDADAGAAPAASSLTVSAPSDLAGTRTRPR